MTDMNHVFLIGRLTRDVGSDERSFAYVGANQTARANLSIAVNRSKREGDQWVEEVSYFDVTIWGKQAESLKQYLQKGKQIAVDGYLRQDRWEKDGQNHSRVIVIANSVQLLGDRNASGQQSGGNARFQARTQESQSFNSFPQNNSFSQGDSSFPEDIPF